MASLCYSYQVNANGLELYILGEHYLSKLHNTALMSYIFHRCAMFVARTQSNIIYIFIL